MLEEDSPSVDNVSSVIRELFLDKRLTLVRSIPGRDTTETGPKDDKDGGR